jgi:hypothetical protein
MKDELDPNATNFMTEGLDKLNEIDRESCEGA